jgi:sporulation protein YunB
MGRWGNYRGIRIFCCSFSRLIRKKRDLLRFFFIFGIILALVIPSGLYLTDLTSQMAISDATDMVILAVNETINNAMSGNDYDYSDFVTLERDDDGNIAAIVTDMVKINALSSQILKDVVHAADSGQLDIQVHLGNLLGSDFLQGRGPLIPLKITMLTSSRIDFKNDFVSAGINQTKHQIILDVTVDIDILIPWDVISTQVVSEVLIAETVIVGKVPETYLNWEKEQ